MKIQLYPKEGFREKIILNIEHSHEINNQQFRLTELTKINEIIDDQNM